MHRKLKILLSNLSLTVISLVLCIIAAEGILRVSGFSDIRYTGREKLQFLKGYYDANTVSGFDIAPDIKRRDFRFGDSSFEIWSNNLGCFDAA